MFLVPSNPLEWMVLVVIAIGVYHNLILNRKEGD